MKIIFNSLKFPTVYVDFTNENDNNNEYYNKFISYWEEQYIKKKHFHYVMNLQELSLPNMGLMIDFVKRQNKLRLSKIQYLDYSIVVINNSFISFILEKMWKICPPLNTIYIVSQICIAEQLLNHINNPFFNKDCLSLFIKCNNITIV